MSNVAFLSGDVHFALNTESVCKSLTGGYKIPEFTSSGLSHTFAPWMVFGHEIAALFPLPIYSKSLIFGDLNYGQISINSSKSTVKFETKNQDGKTILSRKFNLLTDLQ